MKTLSLHPIIPDHELPFCLRRPLVFGDREQINALDRLEADIQKKITFEQKVKDGILKRYAVNVSFTAEQTIFVYAENIADAKSQAECEADIGNCDVDVDAGYAREVIAQ